MDYFKFSSIVFMVIWLHITYADLQRTTDTTSRSSSSNTWSVFFDDPRLKRDKAEYTIIKHVPRKTTRRNPAYRSRRRPKPVYGPPNYTHGAPISEHTFPGQSPSFDASYESFYTPPASGEITVEHKLYGVSQRYPSQSSGSSGYTKHNSSPYTGGTSFGSESFAPSYRSKPAKTFGEPPQQFGQAPQSSSESFYPLSAIPIQTDIKYNSPPSTSYGVPISPSQTANGHHRGEQQQKHQHHHQQPQQQQQTPSSYSSATNLDDTYGPPNYAISNYSTAYDGQSYDKDVGGNFAEPPSHESAVAYDGTSGASYDTAPPTTYEDQQQPSRTQYKTDEFLPTHQQYGPVGSHRAPNYNDPINKQSPDDENFSIQQSIHDDLQHYHNYDDYEMSHNEAAESKKIQKSTIKQQQQPIIEHFESGIGSVGETITNIEVPSDDYVDELLRSDTTVATTTIPKRTTTTPTTTTTPKRRVHQRRTTPTPHTLDTEDLRDAFSSGSAYYPQSIRRPHYDRLIGSRVKPKSVAANNTIEAKNFVLLSAANNRTTSYQPPVVAASPPLSSLLFGKSISSRLPSNMRANDSQKMNRTKSIQIISIQKSQSHSFYAGTMAPPQQLTSVGGAMDLSGDDHGGDGYETSLNVVSTNMQVGDDASGSGTQKEKKTMFWKGKALPANHKAR